MPLHITTASKAQCYNGSPSVIVSVPLHITTASKCAFEIRLDTRISGKTPTAPVRRTLNTVLNARSLPNMQCCSVRTLNFDVRNIAVSNIICVDKLLCE